MKLEPFDLDECWINSREFVASALHHHEEWLSHWSRNLLPRSWLATYREKVLFWETPIHNGLAQLANQMIACSQWIAFSALLPWSFSRAVDCFSNALSLRTFATQSISNVIHDFLAISLQSTVLELANTATETSNENIGRCFPTRKFHTSKSLSAQKMFIQWSRDCLGVHSKSL